MTDLNGSRGMRLIAGNSNQRSGRRDRPVSGAGAGQGPGPPLRRHGSVRRGAGKCARRGHVRHPVDQLSRQRQSDGIADHDRCAAPRIGPAHHRRDPLFRLCPPGPQSRSAHADFGQAGRQSHHRGRRQPGVDGGPPCRADPGFLRHPHRQSLRHAGDGEGHCRPSGHEPAHGGVARCRRRGARPGAGAPAGHRSGHRRQEARAGRRIRSHEHHRRRRGPAPAC